MSEIRHSRGIAFDSIKQIETGRGITDNAVSTKAFEHIRFNDDGSSSEIDESEWQPAKHDDPIISTRHGITSDLSLE
jgi:hypothetical protein